MGLRNGVRWVRDQLHSLWAAAHLKSQGMYSVDRLGAFHIYLRSVSITRMALALLWTPLPALVVIIGTDLFALAPPAEGYHSQGLFWARAWGIATIMIETLMLQMSIFLPSLHMRVRDITLITVFTSSTSTGLMIVLASRIGFPLPFTITMVSPYTMTCLCSCTAFRYGRQMLRDAKVRSQLLEYGIFMSLQYGVTIVYPVYAYIFMQVDSVIGQTLLACLLPLTKLLIKIIMARAMPSLPELRPAFLMFNVEVFNALFIASCLQNASSVVTTIIIMALDTFYNVRDVLNRLNALDRIVKTTATKPETIPSTTTTSATDLVECAVYLLRDSAIAKAVSCRTLSRTTTSERAQTKSVAQILPNGQPQPQETTRRALVVAPYNNAVDKCTSLDASASSDKVALVRGVLELLYVTEYVILTEYVEVVVPAIYAAFLAVVYQLPNRTYYSQLRVMTPASNARAVQRVLIYALLELASVVAFQRLLQRRMRLNPLRQLAFVLADKCWFLPMKLLLWVAFILQSSIQHYGVDYAFQFSGSGIPISMPVT